MKRNLLILLTALAVAFFVPSSFSQKKIEKIVKHKHIGMSGLTEDQQKKAESLDLEMEKAVLPLEAQMEVRQAELKGLAIADNPDKGAIDKKIEEIGALRTQIMKKRIQNKLAVRALLTPEQRIDFDQNILRKDRGFMECCGNGPGDKNIMIMKHLQRGGREMAPALREIEETEKVKEDD
jgi:Spy/CpxP family protein refolding chaperone